MIRQQSLEESLVNTNKTTKVTHLADCFKRCLLWVLLLMVLAPYGLAAQSTLIIPIKGPVEASGHLLYSLYKDGVGFPDQPKQAFRSGKQTVVPGENRIIIQSIPPGRYALALVHDRNDNGELDKNGMGIPSEPFGFSNNVIGAFGPPKFQRAQFLVQPGNNELTPLRLRMGQ